MWVDCNCGTRIAAGGCCDGCGASMDWEGQVHWPDPEAEAQEAALPHRLLFEFFARLDREEKAARRK